MVTLAQDDPLSYFINFCYKRIREEESGEPSVYDLVTLPQHTILYEHHFPKHWLYYEGIRLFKKTGKDISDTAQIYSALVEGIESDEEVVAIFVTNQKDVTSKVSGHPGWTVDPTPIPQCSGDLLSVMAQIDHGDNTFRCCYLTRVTLARFLQERAHRSERGVLQKFTRPRTNHCESVRFHWTPHIKRACRRINTHDYSRATSGVYSRHQSFKNIVQDVREVPLAPAIYNQLIFFIDRLVADYESTHERAKVHHLVVFFQLRDCSPDFVFLFCNLCEFSHGGKNPRSPKPLIRLKGHSDQSVIPSSSANDLQTKFDNIITNNTTPVGGPKRLKKACRRPQSAGVRKAADSFRQAPVVERYNFFGQAITAGFYDSIMKQKDSRHAYVLNKFENLVREVQLRESRELYKMAKMKDRTFGKCCRPKTMGHLANNLLTKGEKLGDSETTTLVQVVRGAQYGAVLAGIVVVAVCCRLVKWAVIDDRSLARVVTCRARQIWKLAQRDRKTSFSENIQSNQMKSSDFTFTKHPKFTPRLVDRIRNIQTIHDQELFHMIDKVNLFLSDRMSDASRCCSVKVSTSSAAVISINNTMKKKQAAMQKRHAKVSAAIEAEDLLGAGDR